MCSAGGWSRAHYNPRMPTIVGARRRGYTPEGFHLFAERIGVHLAVLGSDRRGELFGVLFKQRAKAVEDARAAQRRRRGALAAPALGLGVDLQRLLQGDGLRFQPLRQGRVDLLPFHIGPVAARHHLDLAPVRMRPQHL